MPFLTASQWRRIGIFGFPALVVSALISTPGRADRIVLRGAGQLRGKVEPDPKHADCVLITPERGKTILSFRKDQIAEVVAEPSALDEYLPRRDRASATAQSQYELGLWCESRKLNDLAERHFAAAVLHDSEFAPAHQKLGEVKFEDRWLKGDALRAAQGLVRDKGRWITHEEGEEREKDRAAIAQQTSWERQIRVLREALVNGSDERRREAETQLLAIRDPASVRPLLRMMGDDADPVRMLLARVLGEIPGPEASHALVRLLLAETEPDVRATVLDTVDRREGPEVRADLRRALHAMVPEIVNRAAWALSQMRVVSAVPALIDVLFTTRVETVLSSPNSAAGTPPAGYVVGAPSALGLGSSGYLSSVAVAPGAIGFGISTTPLYSVPPATIPGVSTPASLGSSSGVLGGGGLAAARGPMPRLVTVTIPNVEVQRALVRLTGQDFGFDAAAWKRWARESYQPEPTPARRVPQP